MTSMNHSQSSLIQSRFQAYRLSVRAIWLLFSLVCTFPLFATKIYVVNSQSRTLSRIDTQTDTVQNSFTVLGNIPNKIVADQDYLWCVNSGDNAVQQIDRETGLTVDNILTEVGCNPWDACLDGNYLYVTGLFTNKVYRINTTTGTLDGFVSVGIAPEALCTYNGKLYVTNTGGYQNNYAGSSVSVIDLQSFSTVATIPVIANPQYIIPHNGWLHVSCTGNWTDITGAVCVINPNTNSVVQTINIGGSLGGIWISDAQTGLVGDGSGYSLYRYNAADYSIINGAVNPLSTGGSAVWGNADLIALLAPEWGNNGKVKLLHPDLTPWKEYSVGMSPTDMKFWDTATDIQDNALVSVDKISAFPNPAQAGRNISFVSDKSIRGQLNLYNLRGQMVSSQMVSGKEFSLQTSGLPSGCYLYKLVNTGKSSTVGTGKIVICR